MSLVETAWGKHRERRQLWASRAVPDTGIDLRRPRGEVLLLPWAPVAVAMEMRPFLRTPLPSPPLEPVASPALAPEPLPAGDGIAYSGYVARQVIRHVAARYKSTRGEITGSSRHHAAVRPRFVSIYLTKAITGHSLNQVGRQFGKRDHTTILYAIRKTAARARADFQFASELAALECLIRRHL